MHHFLFSSPLGFVCSTFFESLFLYQQFFHLGSIVYFTFCVISEKILLLFVGCLSDTHDANGPVVVFWPVLSSDESYY